MVNVDTEFLPDPNDLLGTRSIPSISFKDAKVGDSFNGVITDLRTVQVRSYDSGEPEFWDDGKPKLQIEVTLATDYLDPSLDEDDGTRRVYLFGQKLSAAKQEMKAKGLSKLEKGMGFTISFVGEKPASNKKYNNVKMYGIEIEPATSNPDVDALLSETTGAKPVKKGAEGAKLTAAQIEKAKKLSVAGFVAEEIAEAMSVNKYLVEELLDSDTF
jgi:hypothetical protein